MVATAGIDGDSEPAEGYRRIPAELQDCLAWLDSATSISKTFGGFAITSTGAHVSLNARRKCELPRIEHQTAMERSVAGSAAAGSRQN